MDETKSACGRIKTSINLTNWNKHLKAFKLKNFKKGAGRTQDAKSFFPLHLNKYLILFTTYYSVFNWNNGKYYI